MSYSKKKHPNPQSNYLNVDNLKEVDSIKIPELITILTIGSGSWYAILTFILDISNNPDSPTILLGLTITHFINTILIVCCLMVLYYRTVSLTEIKNHNLSRLNKIHGLCIKIIKIYWLPILIFCVIEYLLLSFTTNNSNDWVLSICVILTLLITTILFCYLFKITHKKLGVFILNEMELRFAPIVIIVAYLLFCVVMVLSFSKVEYKFEKEYYYKTETPVLSLSQKGYLLKPIIKTIQFEKIDSDTASNDITKFIQISPESIKKNKDIVLIAYETPIVRLRKQISIKVPYLQKLGISTITD
ncbi:hypothetical protein [Sphingobacterium detergens]|uniref:Uncharacterized protein n=1 Tax=Sphingobacterium detergens TaxID=1145106 RepID=A0A420BF90_SPHD1|nr:hypothetical protein [Sphingobacterium detergens]RKE55348.1 hypothetical protein DFQ12_0179 [Sphingobacterium detergens]